MQAQTRIAGRAAVGEQHIGRERRFVRCSRRRGVRRAELARDPALVRQRALKIFADHALVERRAGEQLVERGLSRSCSAVAASAAAGSANGSRRWRS